MSKCFVTEVDSTVCHIAVANEPGKARATAWLEDGQGLRPVLTSDGFQPEFLADNEGRVVAAILAFLETRLGSKALSPRHCDAHDR